MATISSSDKLAAYVPGTRAWFPDKDAGWVSATLASPVEVSASGDVSLKFTMDDTGAERQVKTTKKIIDTEKDSLATDASLPPLRNPPLLESTEDLTNLSYLNEPAVLHAILNRYSQRIIYTFSGIVLIAVNPFYNLGLYTPEIIQAYSGKQRGQLEPHLFAIAEDAYRCMIRDAKDQTIVVSGESGAGKTVSAKYIMRYFATVEDPDKPGSRKAGSKDNSGMSETEQQILATNPIMEAFGNAKTTRNDNSSRFGKYIEILFDNTNEIVGAQIRTYLLERSRIVFQPSDSGERNFHIFYQLCAGAPSSERKDLGLGDASEFTYLNQGGNPRIQGVDDAEEFKATQKALSTVGVKIEQQWQIFRLLAALLHLGNVKISAVRNDAMIGDEETNLFVATNMLGIDSSEFRKWCVKRQIQMRGEKIVSNLTQAQATVVRDSVTKYIYSSLFDWLVEQMNNQLALGNIEKRNQMIGVLDIYGFERFKVNSYEQFCINYANERLQNEFNQHVFKLEQEEYLQEKIKWTFIDFADNQPTIDMIEGRLGILSLLDEESRLPSGSDASFLQKLYTQIEKKPEYKESFKKPRFGQSSFTVCHYALDVTYESEGFLEKNRDTVPDEHLTLLNSTTNVFLQEVLETATRSANEPKEAAKGEGEKAEKKPTPRKLAGGGMIRKPTLGSQFKSSLVALMQTIDSTNVHYIRCIKPNEAKKAWEVEPQNVLGQLRACGVLETIRISCAGYPSRWTFDDFGSRYYLLTHSSNWNKSSRDLTQLLLESLVKEQDKYQIGLTKIFFRAGMLAAFEQRRTSRLNELVTIMQKNSRAIHHSRKFQNMRSNTLKVQTWWRMISARKMADRMRKEKAATSIQVAVRAWSARLKYQRAIKTIVGIQSHARGLKIRSTFASDKTAFAATQLQSLLRGVLVRRQYRLDRHGVVHLQSCWRRKLAKRELVARRQEAKSATHYREVTYKLENKVVELTQNLQARTKHNKELANKVRALEGQVVSWQNKHEEVDQRSRGLEEELAKPSVPRAEFEALIAAKQAVDADVAHSLKKIKEHEARITDLERELREQAEELEAREMALNSAKNASEEDASALSALRTEVNSLREQLNRANALNTLTKNNQRIENAQPPTFNMATGKEMAPQNKRRPRRHSEVGAALDGPSRDSDEEAMFAAKRSAANANRHVSVAAFDQIPGLPRPGEYGEDWDADEQSEEVIRILENEEQLDEDVLNGLIRYLKIPAPSLQNPPSPKEVLFPAHLISLCTNEFWKYGMVRESERFLANVMQTIQQHIMSFTGDETIVPGFFWLSNVHEIFSFVCIAESDMLQGIGPGVDGSDREMVFSEYERLVTIVKHDLESLSYNLFHTTISEIKKRLHKMVIPALVESQSLPGFVTNETGGRLFNRLLAGNSAPAFQMDDILGILNKVSKALKSYYVEPSVTQQVITELLKLIGTTAFNDILMRRNFCSWKRAMQIQYNIMRIDEWCKSHDMPEGMLQLEHLMQATKLLQLKKATLSDIDIIYDVCWMLTPTQIQKLISHYYVADYENPISPEILKAVAARVVPNDRNDHLLLPPEVDEAGPFESPLPRLVTGIETYCPAYISVPALRRLASCVA